MEKIGHEYVFRIDEATGNLKAVNKGLAGIDEGAKKANASTKETGKGLTSFAVAKGMAIYNLGLGLLRTGINSINENMPFLGQAFSMAGKILMGNLVYPLAKELMPLVMQFFGWVREHRIDFVMLGTVLVSVFRLVSSVIQTAFGLVKSFWNGLFDSIGKGQITLQGFINYMNLVLLKIAFVFTFLGIMLEPFFKMLGNLIGFLWSNAVEPFIEGFVKGFGGDLAVTIGMVSEGISELIALFDKLGLTGGKKLTGMQLVFRAIGFVIGNMILPPVKAMVGWTRLMIAAWSGLIDIFTTAGRVASSFFKQFEILTKIQNLVSVLSTAFDRIFHGSFISGLADAVVSGFKAGWEMLKGTSVGKAFGWIGEKVGFKASGGPVAANRPYVVGEKGPEIMVPQTAGNVIPNSRVTQPANNANATAVIDSRTINITIQGGNDPRQTAMEIKRILEQNKPDYRSQAIDANLKYA